MFIIEPHCSHYNAVRATARDSRGCVVSDGGALPFAVSARGADEHVDVAMTHVGAGIHAGSYVPGAAGTYNVEVRRGAG